MEKMRTKEEILKQCGRGSLKEPCEAEIRYCELEVKIDIRDVLGLIHDELEEKNRVGV